MPTWINRILYSLAAIACAVALLSCSEATDETIVTSAGSFIPPPTTAPPPPPTPVSPAIASVLPEANSNAVPTNLAGIVVYFDKPVTEDSILNAATFTINPSVGISLDTSHLLDANVVLFNIPGNLAASTTYSVSLSGVQDVNGLEVAKVEWQFTTSSTEDTAAPSAPANIQKTVSPSATRVTFTWDASTDNNAVAGYRIYRNTLLIGVSTTNTFTDPNIREYTPYNYVIEAFDYAGNHTASPSVLVSAGNVVDETPPSAPENIDAIVSTSTVSLQWDESTDNFAVAGYNVYRDNALVGTTENTGYLDSGLDQSTMYIYAIEAFDTKNNLSEKTSIIITTKPVTDPVLTWRKPTRREDNTCMTLTELEGIRIYYGKQTRDYTRDIELKETDYICSPTQITDCSRAVEVCTYTPQLPIDTWYFVITVFDTEGRESLFSDQIFYDLTN